ncbi:Per1-like-domain-containing protein [Gilbertella persicaria]|uniref:Per1-like-domain-containing protein n=1 Tax=Gilbertella persicaria TaxID=101096 RepID=UPI00221E3F5D|nr:Per1-like-domain-containing protein [Gilbertella persicaria]KAI8075449.1 Per1-like-domain-containing protein [Gilbertella persicaria]
MPTRTNKQLNVAVIGSGLAGLSAAYLLSQNNDVEVHLFEKNTSLGMDAASISIGPEKDIRIDVSYYSHLSRLYEHLKIPAKKAKFSFGWYRIMQSKNKVKSIPASEVATYTDNNSYLVYSGSRTVGRLDMVTSSDGLLGDIGRFIWRSLIVAYSYVWIMLISLWMHHKGHLKDHDHPICNMTLGHFFKKYYVHPYFAHEIFVPLFAAVCTNSYQSMLNYPASDILEYMAMGLFQESYIAGCGVQQVVKTMSAPLKNVHLETQITSIRPNPNPKYRFQLVDEHGTEYNVDHIIFATQGNQAMSMLEGYSDAIQQTESTFENYKLIQIVQAQIDVLKTFEYDTALVINHTDTRLLPANPNNWKALNLAMVDKSVDPGQSELIVPYPHDTTMTTHILNMTHNAINTKSNDALYMQTTNPCISVDPKKVLSVAWFERATVTLESKKALSQLFQLQKETNELILGPCQGKNGIWFVGSYCWKGIPLLEGCVASAEHVVAKGIAEAEHIQIPVPCGDRQPEYIACVEHCTATTAITQLPLYLRLLRWTPRQDCSYHCMQKITYRAMAEGSHIHQYHGKWPFQRVFGIQEPASVIFSILNGWMHLRYFKRIKQQVSDAYFLKPFYLGIAVVGMNAWLWSTVFHTRDTSITEKLDYFSAGLYILVGFCVANLRIFYLRQTKAWVLSGVCLMAYLAHITYLSSLDRFDYGYNMLACIIVGSLQTHLWLFWSVAQYTPWGKRERRPFAWMAGVSVILVSCAMALEVFDFPPYQQVLDAHSLWHAATIPLAPLFYRFLLRDTELETSVSKFAKEKRSS